MCYAKTVCHGHYQQLRKGKELKPIGYWQRGRGCGGPDSCLFPDCGKSVDAYGYCASHAAQKRRGKPFTPLRVVDGTGHISGDGYRVLSDGGKPYLEHRRVMSEMLGRDLLRSEQVHHINGQRADNRPENLELWSTWQPSGQRVEDKVRWAKEFLSVYDP